MPSPAVLPEVTPALAPPIPIKIPPVVRRRAIRVSTRKICPQCASVFTGSKRQRYCKPSCGQEYRLRHPKRSPLAASWDNLPAPALAEWLPTINEQHYLNAVAKASLADKRKAVRAVLEKVAEEGSPAPAIASCPHGVPLEVVEACSLCSTANPGKREWNSYLTLNRLWPITRPEILGGPKPGPNCMYIGKTSKPRRNDRARYDGNDPDVVQGNYERERGKCASPVDYSDKPTDYAPMPGEPLAASDREGTRPSVENKLHVLCSGSLRTAARKLGISHEQVRKLRSQIENEVTNDRVNDARRALGFTDAEWAEYRLDRKLALARTISWIAAARADQEDQDESEENNR